MSEKVTIGKIEQLTTATPEIKNRWANNVYDRMLHGKTVETSCVLAAQAEIASLRSLLSTAEKERDEANEELAWEMNARMDVEYREGEYRRTALKYGIQRDEALQALENRPTVWAYEAACAAIEKHTKAERAAEERGEEWKRHYKEQAQLTADVSWKLAEANDALRSLRLSSIPVGVLIRWMNYWLNKSYTPVCEMLERLERRRSRSTNTKGK